jgi:putative addiction module component (TIGR02574 family)
MANAHQLPQDALRLPRDDREELAGMLLDSLDADAVDEGVADMSAAEIRRRLEDYRAGRSKGRPWNEIEAALRARVTAIAK